MLTFLFLRVVGIRHNTRQEVTERVVAENIHTIVILDVDILFRSNGNLLQGIVLILHPDAPVLDCCSADLQWFESYMGNNNLLCTVHVKVPLQIGATYHYALFG